MSLFWNGAGPERARCLGSPRDRGLEVGAVEKQGRRSGLFSPVLARALLWPLLALVLTG